MLRRSRVFLFALSLAAMPWLASAGVIGIDKAEGSNVVALLSAEGRMHVDAMQAMLLSERPALVEKGTRRFFKNISGRMHGATLARIDYSYEMNGSTHVRSYHARSGRSMALIADLANAKPRQDGSSATESVDTDAPSVDSGVIDDATRDAGEAIFYPPDTPADVRVAALPDDASPIESVDIGDDKSHATDAEIKIARRIDADIQQGVVPGHGKLTGYVSKTVCESCTNALNELAMRHDIDGMVYHLIEPDPARPGTVQGSEGLPDDSTLLERSRSDSLKLKALRSGYANKTLRKGVRRVPASSWMDVRSIERAEASSALSELPGACE
jgi:hypothetical protein